MSVKRFYVNLFTAFKNFKYSFETFLKNPMYKCQS